MLGADVELDADNGNVTVDVDADAELYLDYGLQTPDHILPLKLNESWAARRLIEALSHLPPTSSNSAPMRFQQKTQQEQEQRRCELNTADGHDANQTLTAGAAAVPSATAQRQMGNGKVRQMFDERRRGAGIDRSKPLKPIAPISNMPPECRTPPRILGGRKQATPRFTTTTTTRPAQQLNKGLSTLSLKERPLSTRRWVNDSNNNTTSKYNVAGTFNRSQLKPVVTKKTPPSPGATAAAAAGKNRLPATPPTTRISSLAGSGHAATSTIKSVNGFSRPSRSVSTPPNSANVMQRLTGGEQLRLPMKMSVRSPPTAAAAAKANATKSPVTKISMQRGQPTPPSTTVTPTPEGTVKCRYCGRSFNTDRLTKHEAVCQRTINTRRKIFDASKQRVKGTESEKYTKRPSQRSQSTYSSAAQHMSLNTGIKKNNWRKKHEEFIQSIRAAKQVQAHLARGGKLSDLPPPPPSENADYIQCPHCGRRFNQQAAERHIPRCATMLHNKPRRDAPTKKR